MCKGINIFLFYQKLILCQTCVIFIVIVIDNSNDMMIFQYVNIYQITILHTFHSILFDAMICYSIRFYAMNLSHDNIYIYIYILIISGFNNCENIKYYKSYQDFEMKDVEKLNNKIIKISLMDSR
jgi:hypothetical protein